MPDHSYSELLTATVDLNLSDFEKKMKDADTTMKAFEEDGDFKGKNATFTGVSEAMINQATKAMQSFAEKVMVESLIEVPKDTGTLADSHNVGEPKRVGNHVTIEMGYGYGDEVNPDPHEDRRIAAQYAIPVHEIRDATHVPPTKDHYLLDPLIARAPMLGPDIAKAMKVGETLAVVGGAGITAGTMVVNIAIPVPESFPFGGGTTFRGPGGRFIKVKK